MDKYMHEHNRLFTMDHFSPYGPWPSDFSDWTSFHNALFKSSQGTTTMDAIIAKDTARGSIVIAPSDRWEFYPKIGERIVISRCHPALDNIVSGPVAKVSRWSFKIDWKTHWEPFEEFADKVRSEDKRCPSGHFRVDLEVGAISIGRVDQALRTLTAVRGMETHNVSVVTPLQAMLVCNDFMADDIEHINNADSDRRRQEDGFTRAEGGHTDNRGNNYGASDASGASDARF